MNFIFEIYFNGDKVAEGRSTLALSYEITKSFLQNNFIMSEEDREALQNGWTIDQLKKVLGDDEIAVAKYEDDTGSATVQISTRPKSHLASMAVGR